MSTEGVVLLVLGCFGLALGGGWTTAFFWTLGVVAGLRILRAVFS